MKDEWLYPASFLDAVPILLARSQGVPLRVRLNVSRTECRHARLCLSQDDFRTLIQLIVEQAGRIDYLDVRFPGQNRQPHMDLLLAHGLEFPALKTLSIWDSLEAWQESRRRNLF